jgi:hypothetical protein
LLDMPDLLPWSAETVFCKLGLQRSFHHDN